MDLPHLRCVGLPVIEVLESSPGRPETMKKEREPGSTAPTATGDAAAHGEPLEAAYAQKLPVTDLQILAFLLAFLVEEGIGHAPVFINGGYVRDLLLGKEPDDLDLSICLRDCPEDVTVSSLLESLPGFAIKRPELGIKEVKIATILSNESKDKQLDTFKAHLINFEGKKTEVDVMPTIGEETYGEDNRIPIRDQRGAPEQDALRRDLTIGALLLRVRLDESSPFAGLAFELFDFYGGVADLRRGVLRSPCPSAAQLSDVWPQVLRSPTEEQLATGLGLRSLPEQEAIQVLWWAKVLIDDPLRICRALRFASKFGFELHAAFWLAAPFALEALRSKVAGSRKNTEYQKIGGYGCRVCADFFEFAFARTFGVEGELRLAQALFGGQDEKGRPRVLSLVTAFDAGRFRALAETLERTVGAKPDAAVADAAELVGGLLAAAISCATLVDGDAAYDEFMRACDGMCVSNGMREAGTSVLQAAKFLASPAAEDGFANVDAGFAHACDVDPEAFRLHVQVWEAFTLCDVPRAGPPGAGPHRRKLALGLMASVAGVCPKKVDAVAGCVERLEFQRPAVKGSLLCTPSVLEVPAPLRTKVKVRLEVALRLRKVAEPIDDAEQLKALFEKLPAIGRALDSSVWYLEDGKTLRDEFRVAKKGKDAPKKK